MDNTQMPDSSSDIGIHSLDRFVFSAPDLAVAENFYRAFGLDPIGGRRGLDLRTYGCEHVWGTVIEGARKRLHHLSFGAYERDLPVFDQRLRRLGIERTASPHGFDGEGLWFRDHDGVLVQIRPAEKSSPKQPTEHRPVAGGVPPAKAPPNSRAPVTRPTRFAHVLLFTSSVDRAVRFYMHVLGLRLSDRSGQDIAFLHGIHGSDHHLVAVVRSDGPGLHHTSWDVRSIDEVGIGRMQMAQAGYPSGWGVGRHVLGSNYFHYVKDPWGSYAEYSFDMDFIPKGFEWQPGDYPSEDAFYLWGPDTPPDFAQNRELD